MAHTYMKTVELEELSCGECGMIFAVPVGWLKARRDSGECNGRFYCPNGHVRVFRESELQKVQKQLVAKQAALDQAHADALNERARVMERDRTIVAMKGASTKLKKRISAGVCPCCKRTFKQLAAHMANQHPDFTHDACEPA